MNRDRIGRLARAIARAEGWYVAGSRPQALNNPGSLKDPATGDLRSFDGPISGFSALMRQVRLMALGGSAVYTPDMSLRQVGELYTGGDRPQAWARIVALDLGVTPETPLSELV